MTPEQEDKLNRILSHTLRPLCECGCGNETDAALRDSRWGYKKGDPLKYIRGHRPQTETRLAIVQKWHKEHPEQAKRHQKMERLRLRAYALAVYGGKCACCGETEAVFLCIDHPNGGGNIERRAQGHRGGTAFYRWLKANNYPEGYRVLCWNCNAAFAIFGWCPHNPPDKPIKVPSARVWAVVR